VALSAILQLVAVEWAPLMHLLGTQRLSVAQLAACAAVAAVPCAALLTARAVRPRPRPEEPLMSTNMDSGSQREEARSRVSGAKSTAWRVLVLHSGGYVYRHGSDAASPSDLLRNATTPESPRHAGSGVLFVFRLRRDPMPRAL
jgi:hypothetical protein